MARESGERSQSGPAPIESLIAQTRQIVETGARMVTGTSAALDMILKEVSGLERQVEGIGLATRHQAEAGGKIARQTETIRINGEQNAAAAVQLAATVEETTRILGLMARASEEVAHEMAAFKTDATNMA